MKIRMMLTLATVLGLLASLAGPALAAQGQITEVNPSGTGKIIITLPLNAKGVITDVNPSGVGFKAHGGGHRPGECLTVGCQ